MKKLMVMMSVVTFVFLLGFGIAVLSAQDVGARGPDDCIPWECEIQQHPVIPYSYPTEMCFIDGKWGLWIPYCDGVIRNEACDVVDFCLCKDVCVVNWKHGLKTEKEPPQ